MTAIRRSTRLSQLNVSTTATSPSTRPSTSHRTSADIWRRRQTKNTTVDSDDEAEVEVFNENDMNELNNKEVVKSKKLSDKMSESNLRTPHCSKKATRPMPASKKREYVLKRAMAQQDSDTSDDNVKQVEDVSPPKQLKHQKPFEKHLLTPTRLLDRLSIDDDRGKITGSDSEGDDAAEKVSSEPISKVALPPRNKYQNARRVLNSNETEKLPGREQQLQELREYFTNHVGEQRSGSLYISGQPGTGKTACVSLLLHSSDFKHKFERVYINCTSIASVGAIYKKLSGELNLQTAGRTERDHLAAIRHHLCHTSRMVLIVLDEIDQLCSSRQSVLYTIFELPALPKAKVLIVGIANSLDLTDRALMRLNARCELKPQLMHFPPYTKQQIVDIFRSRLQEADVLDIFPPVTLQLLAAKVSSVSGDVRRALDIGRRVVEIAEQQKNAGQRAVDLKELDIGEVAAEGKRQEQETLQPVQVTQVAAVLNKIYGASQNLDEDIEESFPLQQKLMLCSLMLMLRKERNKDITMGRLHEVYRRVCTKRNILALDQAEFVGLVDLVQTRGILRIIKKKEPRFSKIQLQWDEDEVNGALADKQLIASILDDVSCLYR